MNRPLRINTPANLAELLDRVTVNGPLGELEPGARAAAEPNQWVRAAAPGWGWLRRDLTVGTATAGGHTVGTTTGDVSQTLRGFSVVADAGATVVPITAGSPNIAVVATAPTASWVSENTADTPSEPTFSAAVQLTPATVRVSATVSRTLLKQSVVAERMVRAELLQAVGRAVDAAALGAGGGAAPTGIAGTSGRITQSGTSLSWATLADVERQVLLTGARLERLRYIATPAVRELLMGRERAAGSGFIIDGDRIGAVPVAASVEAPDDALILGDWSQLVIGIYGTGPVILVNPYRYATSGHVEFSIHVECAIGIPRPGAFAHVSAIT